ncbi:MAG: glycosyltransferase family 39 protein [Planctomycetes bacterium]|nr:glycosyltransferase family 39 protein [Planctomycetota bacterium]
MADSRLAALLAGAAFLARLVACLGTAIFGTDGGNLLLMADWMRAGRFHDALSLSYHPLYPLLVAVAGPLAGGTESAGAAVSVLLGAAAAFPLFLTVRDIFGRPAAFFTTLLYAFSPAILEVQSEAMTEGAYMFFLFSSLRLAWKMREQPSLERGAVLGACASAAFLARPEGLLAVTLAVAWPLSGRDSTAKRASGALVTLAVALLLASPYLLWVKAERGRWALSLRASARSAERALAGDESASEQEAGAKSRLYGIYVHSMFRMTAMGLLIPFHLLGLASLKRIGWRNGLFYFSWPLGLLGGTLFVLRAHDFMSGRYLLAGMTLLNALAALGMTRALEFAAERKLRPALGLAVLLAVAVLPGLGMFRLRRHELQSARSAADWIRSQGPPPAGISGPVSQVAYLAGCRSIYSGLTEAALREQIGSREVEYYVYSEKDVQRRPAYIALLRSCDLLQAPVAVAGPPGTLQMYVQRVR